MVIQRAIDKWSIGLWFINSVLCVSMNLVCVYIYLYIYTQICVYIYIYRTINFYTLSGSLIFITT